MIIIHNHHRIMALAESYDGPDPFMPAPEGFDESRLGQYRLIDGEWIIPPPKQVTMRQGRLALLGAGLLDAIDGAINAIEDPVQKAAARIEWEYATTIDRDSQFVSHMAQQLGLTDQQLDALFATASTL